MTEVALIAITVPRAAGDLVGVGAGPSDQLLREYTLRILGADELVHLVTVDVPGLGARTSLDMMGDAGGRGELGPAERTLYVRSAMDARVEMLIMLADDEHEDTVPGMHHYHLDTVRSQESAHAITAVEMLVDLVLLHTPLIRPGLVAELALELEVVLCPHVCLSGFLASKVPLASVTLVGRAGVSGSVAVLVSSFPARGEGLAAGAASVVFVVHLENGMYSELRGNLRDGCCRNERSVVAVVPATTGASRFLEKRTKGTKNKEQRKQKLKTR
jgi:hypothetical protein